MNEQPAKKYPKNTDEKTLKEAFEQDGYVVVEGWFGAELQGLRDEIGQVLAPEIQVGESIDQTIVRLDAEDKQKLLRVAQLVGKLDAFFDINKACVPLAKLLLPSGYITLKESALLLGLPMNKRLFYGWHQESSYITAYPHFLTYWIPIMAPSTVQGGTMSCLEGSHKEGLLPYESVKYAEKSTTTHIPQGMDEWQKKYREVYFVTNPGDLVVIHQDMIHRSTDNNSDKVRFTGSVCLASLTTLPEVVQ